MELCGSNFCFNIFKPHSYIEDIEKFHIEKTMLSMSLCCSNSFVQSWCPHQLHIRLVRTPTEDEEKTM